jgi:hypothetical protein
MDEKLKLTPEEVRQIMEALFNAEDVDGADDLHDKLATETGANRHSAGIIWEITVPN